jgi:uncharacterized membrane protein YhaH (DUF805 family)
MMLGSLPCVWDFEPASEEAGTFMRCAMNLFKLFFSFHGRVNRAGFWLVSVTWFILGGVMDYVWSESSAADIPVGRDHLVDTVLILVMLLPIASCLAVGVTRLHDRNKRAWWLLVFYLCPPVIETFASLANLDSAVIVMVNLMVLSKIIMIWAFVELGCLRGTIGENRYGPDPLADVAMASFGPGNEPLV